jgi:hypothetical protein
MSSARLKLRKHPPIARQGIGTCPKHTFPQVTGSAVTSAHQL